MSNRNIDDLHPVVKQMAEKFIAACKQAGITVTIYCTLRTSKEQDDLYAQGRTKPGSIVTNAKGGESTHNYGLAFDCGPTVDGKIAWDNTALFEKMGKIGKSVGLTWGGDWKMKDMPHFEWTNNLTIKELQAGKRPPTSIT